MKKFFDVEIDGQVELENGKTIGELKESSISITDPDVSGGSNIIYFDAYSDGEGGVDLADGKTSQDIADAFGDGNPNVYIRLPDEGTIAQVTCIPSDAQTEIARNAGQRFVSPNLSATCLDRYNLSN